LIPHYRGFSKQACHPQEVIAEGLMKLQKRIAAAEATKEIWLFSDSTWYRYKVAKSVTAAYGKVKDKLFLILR
jgi:NADH:ubiquinone oxidoreductase subunit B-like Fe-S oxidoreductase